MKTRSTRRELLRRAAAGAGLLILPRSQSARAYAANEQLQIAVVGPGGRGAGFVAEEGWSSIRQQIGGRVAALCDVNRKKAAETYARYPDVPKYEDYREMLDQMAGKLDGVVVSTPDHSHAPASACALRAGLHVFCEKGLTRRLHEARTLADLALEQRLSTQRAGRSEGVETGRSQVCLAGCADATARLRPPNGRPSATRGA